MACAGCGELITDVQMAGVVWRPGTIVEEGVSPIVVLCKTNHCLARDARWKHWYWMPLDHFLVWVLQNSGGHPAKKLRRLVADADRYADRVVSPTVERVMGEPDADPDVLAVEALIADQGGVTFVEIAQLLARRGVPVEGTLELVIADRNIVLWAGMSERFMTIMEAVRARRRVTPRPTSALTYMADGGFLRLPLAKQARRRYTTPHWLPTVFSTARTA